MENLAGYFGNEPGAAATSICLMLNGVRGVFFLTTVLNMIQPQNISSVRLGDHLMAHIFQVPNTFDFRPGLDGGSAGVDGEKTNMGVGLSVSQTVKEHIVCV